MSVDLAVPARRGRVLCVPLFLALAGCGGPEVPPSVDVEDAKKQLSAALDAWKAGEPFGALAAKSPPVVFSEPVWEAGTQLVSYELGPVELHGRQGRCTARLQLRDKDGRQYERRIGYQIDTIPRVVIVREGLGM